MAPSNRAIRLQYGVIPYRFTAEGALEILLLTSRGTKRWIVPKGWPIRGLKPPKSAAREAYEEAGVRGEIADKAIGAFTYEKRLDDKSGIVICEVQIFPLLVKRQLKRWPEMNQRELRWLSPVAAAAMVEEGSLRDLITQFAIGKARPAVPAAEA